MDQTEGVVAGRRVRRWRIARDRQTLLPAGAAIQNITAVRTGKLAVFPEILDLSTFCKTKGRLGNPDCYCCFRSSFNCSTGT
jgi:hypothetical protein